MEKKIMTVKDFVSEIRDKANMHEAMVRHGYYLPSISSGICTDKYLKDVSMSQVWCPKFLEIRL